jgi:hypothetical protein
MRWLATIPNDPLVEPALRKLWQIFQEGKKRLISKEIFDTMAGAPVFYPGF